MMQRSVLINLCLAVPILLLWTQLGWLLQALGQNRAIVEVAMQYLWALSPQLAITAVSIGIEKFQTTQVLNLCMPHAFRSMSGV